MTDVIEKMNLPWRDKPKRGGLLRAMGRIGDIVKFDVNQVNRAFQPLLCDEDMLNGHSSALGLPALDEDIESRRDRVSTAAYFLEERGQRGQVFNMLDSLVSGRYKVHESSKDSFRVGISRVGVDPIGPGSFLAIRVRNLTASERTRIYDVLDSLLDPDIEIVVVPWTPASPSNLTMDQISLYGGSRWLSAQFEDIGNRIHTRVLPEDAFRIGHGRMGYAVVWGSTPGERVRIYCPGGCRAAVTKRAASLFADELNWEVVNE